MRSSVSCFSPSSNTSTALPSGRGVIFADRTSRGTAISALAGVFLRASPPATAALTAAWCSKPRTVSRTIGLAGRRGFALLGMHRRQGAD
ncbi:MAG TPA: hypothetical protein VGR52_10990 [Stellaceae bacterium]|nr:hypothetical protein [Stellaceae bacterium]